MSSVAFYCSCRSVGVYGEVGPGYGTGVRVERHGAELETVDGGGTSCKVVAEFAVAELEAAGDCGGGGGGGNGKLVGN